MREAAKTETEYSSYGRRKRVAYSSYERPSLYVCIAAKRETEYSSYGPMKTCGVLNAVFELCAPVFVWIAAKRETEYSWPEENVRKIVTADTRS